LAFEIETIPKAHEPVDVFVEGNGFAYVIGNDHAGRSDD
jgi:hypothetical protein